MITAKEIKELSLWEIQLEQIEWGLKQSKMSGGNSVYFRKDKLEKKAKDKLIELGYKVEVSEGMIGDDDYKITWSEE